MNPRKWSSKTYYEVTQKNGKPLGYFYDLEVAKQFCQWHNKHKSDNSFAFHLGMLVGILLWVVIYTILSDAGL